jgi:hypothetical protein
LDVLCTPAISEHSVLFILQRNQKNENTALFDQPSMTTESPAHTELIAPKIMKIAQVFVMRQRVEFWRFCGVSGGIAKILALFLRCNHFCGVTVLISSSSSAHSAV